MNIDLSNRVVAVTGGSSGIGAGIATLAAQCGAKVAVIARDDEKMQEVVSEIESQGRQAMAAKADITKSNEVGAAFEKIAKKFGRIDGVVANAGINGTWAPIDEISPEQWRKTIDVNLTGTYLTVYHSVPYLRKHNSGSIVIMSSINGTRTFSNEGASAYAASKAGQFALAQMLALELAASKIRVNVICPGAIESKIHGKTKRKNLEKIETPVEFPQGNIPLTDGDFGKPEQVASMVAFLLCELSDHITGTPVWIDGGQSLIV
ncbi:MAG TPA: 3-oxoacyl-[acyl-carrier-protein] reductase [Planctomycetaceae bacterium]|nr:3-oxoacyl-[acyl-carrier-protein] reductase [Planctomycetaceae bacterium]